jgi:hypothetical protein
MAILSCDFEQQEFEQQQQQSQKMRDDIYTSLMMAAGS